MTGCSDTRLGEIGEKVPKFVAAHWKERWNPRVQPRPFADVQERGSNIVDTEFMNIDSFGYYISVLFS